MKIVAKKSGGFSGAMETYPIDSEILTAAQQSALRQQMDQLDFFNADTDLSPDAVGADMTRWQIAVIDDAREHTVSFVEDGSVESAPWQAFAENIQAGW